jgi:hypothetical protein
MKLANYCTIELLNIELLFRQLSNVFLLWLGFHRRLLPRDGGLCGRQTRGPGQQRHQSRQLGILPAPAYLVGDGRLDILAGIAGRQLISQKNSCAKQMIIS